MITRDRAHQKESIDIVSDPYPIMTHRDWPEEALEAWGSSRGNFEILHKLSRVELASISYEDDCLTILQDYIYI